MRQRPAQVLSQSGADLFGEGARRLQPRLELSRRVRQPEGLQSDGVAGGVLSDQHEVAGVGDQHEPVPAPVAGHLVAGRGQPRVVVRRLDLHDAALRGLPLAPPATLQLSGGVEAEVGMARALLRELAYAVDPWASAWRRRRSAGSTAPGSRTARRSRRPRRARGAARQDSSRRPRSASPVSLPCPYSTAAGTRHEGEGADLLGAAAPGSSATNPSCWPASPRRQARKRPQSARPPRSIHQSKGAHFTTAMAATTTIADATPYPMNMLSLCRPAAALSS